MQDLRVERTLDARGALKLGFADVTMPPGRASNLKPCHYFVDGTHGSDGNDGLSWQRAFATFEKGIDQCRFTLGTTSVEETTDHRAFLFIAPGHYDETTQLLWSGHQISIIGCAGGIPGHDKGVSFNYSGNTSATAVMLVNGSGNELYNFHINSDAAVPSLYIYYPGDNNWIHRLVIQGDGTNSTYGIYTTSMKGSVIEDCTIHNHVTTGISVHYDAANQYAIHGGLFRNQIYSNASNCKGIYVHGSLTAYNFWIKNNLVALRNGSSCKGIDVDSDGSASGAVYVVDNYVSVPTSATAIEHAGGEQFWFGNHTTAGAVTKDPNPATE